MVGYETTQSHLVKLFGKGNLVYRWGCVLRFHGQQWLIWVTVFGIAKKYFSSFTVWNWRSVKVTKIVLAAIKLLFSLSNRTHTFYVAAMLCDLRKLKWYLGYSSHRYVQSRQFKPNKINQSTSPAANCLERKHRYMQQVAINYILFELP